MMAQEEPSPSRWQSAQKSAQNAFGSAWSRSAPEDLQAFANDRDCKIKAIYTPVEPNGKGQPQYFIASPEKAVEDNINGFGLPCTLRDDEALQAVRKVLELLKGSLVGDKAQDDTLLLQSTNRKDPLEGFQDEKAKTIILSRKFKVGKMAVLDSKFDFVEMGEFTWKFSRGNISAKTFAKLALGAGVIGLAGYKTASKVSKRRR